MRRIATHVAIIVTAPIAVPLSLALVPAGFWLELFGLTAIALLLWALKARTAADIDQIEEYVNRDDRSGRNELA